LHRLARDPLKPSRVVLLISLTAGLILFTHTFGASLAHSQEQTARYRAGADLRVSLASSDPPLQQLDDLPGVLAAAPVFSSTVQIWGGETAQLLALDPATFAQVARYPSALAGPGVPSLLDALQPETTSSRLPAIFSSPALPDDKEEGDRVVIDLAGRPLAVSVRTTASSFPALSNSFVLVSLPALETRLDLDATGTPGSREAWLAVDPAQHRDLARQLRDRLLDDAQAQLGALQRDALAQGTSGALRLNTLTLALFSLTAFALFHFFAAQQRVVEFGVLRAMGLSARQLLALLLTEGALALALGLAAGVGIGYGLSRVMIPYLSQALSASLSGVAIEQILVDWPSVAQIYALLVASYGLVLVLLLLLLTRVGVHQAMRMGDE
jgi:putative ABC transport system permease protein